MEDCSTVLDFVLKRKPGPSWCKICYLQTMLLLFQTQKWTFNHCHAVLMLAILSRVISTEKLLQRTS